MFSIFKSKKSSAAQAQTESSQPTGTSKGVLDVSRRSFLRGAGAAMAGAIAYTSGAGGLLKKAHAATADKSAVVLLFLHGGYNALFCSADSFISKNSFGVTSSNVQKLGNSQLFVDKTTFGTMPSAALSNMASIGIRHGITSHDAARTALWNMGSRGYSLMLADAIGGSAAIKYASVGDYMPYGANTPVNGVSVQRVSDMQAALDALGSTVDPGQPDRGISAAALGASTDMSSAAGAANPNALASLVQGYAAAIQTLQAPVETFSFSELNNAYSLNNSTAVKSFPSQLAAAELMIRAGANVVSLIQGNPSGVQRWDSHGDDTGMGVRNRMRGQMTELNTFLTRMMALSGYNVTTVIFGDFSRSLPGSNHQPNLTATVIGPNVKLGTTGHVDSDVGLPASTPGIQGLWAYLAAAAKTSSQPFGANPHPLVLG
jgi:hypothetical protein